MIVDTNVGNFYTKFIVCWIHIYIQFPMRSNWAINVTTDKTEFEKVSL